MPIKVETLTNKALRIIDGKPYGYKNNGNLIELHSISTPVFTSESAAKAYLAEMKNTLLVGKTIVYIHTLEKTSNINRKSKRTMPNTWSAAALIGWE